MKFPGNRVLFRVATLFLLLCSLAPQSVGAQSSDIPEEWEEQGIVSEYEYKSPNFGTEVEWDDPVALDEYYELPAGQTERPRSRGGNYDYLYLWIEDPIVYISVFSTSLTEMEYDESEEMVDDFIAYYEGENYLGNPDYFSEDAEVVLSSAEAESGGVVILDYDGPSFPYVVIRESRMIDDDASVEIYFFAYVSDLEDMLEVVTEDVEIERDPLITLWDVDEILEAVEDAEPPADDDEDTSDDDRDDDRDDEDDPLMEWEDAGLISESAYESPNYGYTVEWGDPFFADLDGEPAGSGESQGVDFDFLLLNFEDVDHSLSISGSLLEDYDVDLEDLIESQVDMWTSDDHLEQLGDDAYVVLDDAGNDQGAVAVYVANFDGPDTVQYYEIREASDNDVVLEMLFIVHFESESDIGPALEALDESVEVEGDSVLGVFSVDDVVTAVEEQMRSLEDCGDSCFEIITDEDETPEDEVEPTATPEDEEAANGSSNSELPSGWADVGFVSTTEWESPQFSFSVSWESPVAAENIGSGPPASTHPEGNLPYDHLRLRYSDPLLGVNIRGTNIENTGLSGEQALQLQAEQWQEPEGWDTRLSGEVPLFVSVEADRVVVLYALENRDGSLLIYLFTGRTFASGDVLILSTISGTVSDTDNLANVLTTLGGAVEIDDTAILLADEVSGMLEALGA